MKKVWGSGFCTLQGVFRLYQLQQNFNLYNPKIQLHVQLRIRLYELSMEFWHPRILMTIARGVGIPLQIDQAKRDMKYGFYARILVEVDLSKPLLDFVTVELLDFEFDVEVHYENLHPKCNSCNKFDHGDHQCRIKKNPNTQHTSKISDPKQKFKPTQSKPQEKLNRMINDNGLNSKKDSSQTADEETESSTIVAENSNGKHRPSNQHQIE
ncbi:DUF4283 domain protein [Melia azedarach]|uniref:DUF4283 domain protein n=1 Tax=Melia azedarach TaxID=155640 RepID=A0ACC1WVY2_MELAZ|nr:DUF4283 domain protein [Melia azedarach]